MRTSHVSHVALQSIALLTIALTSCRSQRTDGPPTVRLDEDVCHRCNMIISDQRFATATLIAGSRGTEPRLFDDFNCQAQFEAEETDLQIVGRWSHDYVSATWLKTESAHFVISDDLRTPMASRTAAFATLDEARRASAEFGGEVFTFDVVWRKLGGRPD